MSLDLNGHEFKIAINQDPPFFEFEEKNGSLSLKEGLEVEILKGLSHKYNFSYKLIDCDGSWGSLLPNKSWTGIVGMLVDQRADMGLSEISITADRADYIEFSYPHTISTITYITSIPMFHSKISSMFSFFDLYVWISFIFTLFVLTLYLFLLSKVDSCGRFYDLIWTAFEYLMSQSAEYTNIKRNWMFDIFLGFWLIFCAMFSSIYGNCIYSQIVFPLKLKSIDTIHELYEAKVRGEITVSLLEFTSKFDLMRQSDLVMYQKLSESMTFYKDDSEGINSVVRAAGHPKAHIISREYLNYVSIKYDQGAFYSPPYNDETTFFLDFLAIAYKNNFQYKRRFDETILAMKEAGLFDYWMLIVKAKTQSRESRRDDKQSKFDLHHFDIYFYLLFFGFIASCSIFIFEYFFKYHTYNKRGFPYNSKTYSTMIKHERERVLNTFVY